MKPESAHLDMESYSNESEEKFIQLYQTYRNRLLNFASGILPDKAAAEDLVQELFTDMLDKRIRIGQIERLNAYLHRAISNRIRNLLRNTDVYNRHVQANFHLNYHHYEFVEPDFNRQDLYHKIRSCLSEIPSKYSVVFILKRVYHLSTKQISQKLSRPQDTVDKQLRKATYLIRKKIPAPELL